MLLALLSPFLGILGSLLPAIVRIFERKQEFQYQIELQKLQVQAAIQNAQIQIAIEDAKADVEDSKSVRSYDNNIDGGRFINTLKASIRPVITYVFFITFIGIKMCVVYVMVDQGASMMDMVHAVWDQDTVSVFGTVIGFWFGTRFLEKTGYGGAQYGRVIVNKPFQTK